MINIDYVNGTVEDFTVVLFTGALLEKSTKSIIL